MSGYNPPSEGVDGAAVWLALSTGLVAAAIGFGVAVKLDAPWWAALFLVAWPAGGIAAAAVWWKTYPTRPSDDDRPGIEDGGVLRDLAVHSHRERAITAHTRRLP